MSKAIPIDELDRIFDAVMDLEPDQRRVIVEREAQNNLVLILRIMKLLELFDSGNLPLGKAATARKEIILQSALNELSHTREFGENNRIGESLGPYTLREIIGIGGRSTVYAATKEDEKFQQEFAIKVMRRGIDTDDVLRRFFVERNILARLQHPAISAILDAGSTWDGLPYFVMERVRGCELSSYLQRENLNLLDRLRLFIHMARALVHAHSHLVVHRDIKPSNIMVRDDGSPVLLDFGIARVLNPDELPSDIAITREEVRPLTARYASPEQIDGDSMTIASDIFQLGLVLFEMLTGVLPKRDTKPNGDRSSLPLMSAVIATKECSGLPYGKKIFTGDLDTIVNKALRIIPENRYATVNDLINDIERYLKHQPILAHPPSLVYQTHKFLQRRPWAAPMVLIIILSTTGFIVNQQFHNAQMTIERDLAQESADRADAIKKFMISVLQSPNPYNAGDINVTVTQALLDADIQAEKEFGNRLDILVEVWTNLADVLFSLEEFDRANSLWGRIIELRTEMFGPNDLRTLEGKYYLATTLARLQRWEEALTLLQNLATILDKQNPDAFKLRGMIHSRMGRIYLERKNVTEALPELLSGLQLLELADSDHDENIHQTLRDISGSYLLMDNPEGALPYINRAIKLAESNKNMDQVSIAASLSERATALSQLYRLDEAAFDFEQSLKIYEATLNPLNEHILVTMNNLARFYDRVGDHQRAENLLLDVIKRKRQKYEDQLTRTLGISLTNLGMNYFYQGKTSLAFKAFNEATEQFSTTLDSDSFISAMPDVGRSMIYNLMGNWDQQYYFANRAWQHFINTREEGYRAREFSRCLMGHALFMKGSEAEGRALMDGAYFYLSNQPEEQIERVQCEKFRTVYSN